MIASLLRPKALLSHVLVLAVAVVCVALGQWQLDRLDQVRDNNARLAERAAMAPLSVEELVDGEVDPAELEFRRVEATGTFRPSEEVLQRNQTLQGRSGFHVLTPLELGDGAVVLVLRGWVPPEYDEPPVEAAAPPAGEVTVEGVLERSVDQPSFGARDPQEGELQRVFHADTSRLDRQIDGELFPLVLRVAETSDDVAFDALPRPIGLPELDEGNHLSYAVQWHVFAVLAVGTYGAWLWSRRRRDRSADDGAQDDDDEGGGGGGGSGPSPVPDRPRAGVGARTT